MSKIAYEPHPVSADRKAELRSLGFTIVDEIYAPKSDAKPADALTREDIARMPRGEVVALLGQHGVEGATGKVSDLRRWLTNIIFLGDE